MGGSVSDPANHTGGLFDGKASPDERRQYLLKLIRSAASAGPTAASTAALCDAELNALLARGEAEQALFEREDARLLQQERAAWAQLCMQRSSGHCSPDGLVS